MTDIIKNRISLALKDPSLQQGFEIVCKESAELKKKIEVLEKELEKERKLNTEIKARFVKCNTCTPDMKEKCLMFNENLCEGERCEELVDLMSLVNKRDTDDKLAKAKELLKFWVNDFYDAFNNQSRYEARHKVLVETEQFIKEIEKND